MAMFIYITIGEKKNQRIRSEDQIDSPFGWRTRLRLGRATPDNMVIKTTTTQTHSLHLKLQPQRGKRDHRWKDNDEILKQPTKQHRTNSKHRPRQLVGSKTVCITPSIRSLHKVFTIETLLLSLEHIETVKGGSVFVFSISFCFTNLANLLRFIFQFMTYHLCVRCSLSFSPSLSAILRFCLMWLHMFVFQLF